MVKILVRIYKKNVFFFSNLFFRKTNNLINRVNTVYNDSILNRIYSNVGNSTLYGLELGLQFKPIKKWSNYFGGNVFYQDIIGEFDNRPVNTNALVYSFNGNSTFKINSSSFSQSCGKLIFTDIFD